MTRMVKRPMGFDDFTVRQQFIDQICERQEKEFPEISVFNDTMNNFYNGAIRRDKEDKVTIEAEKAPFLNEQTKKELMEVITQQYEYPDDTNLRALTLTQDTQKALGSILNSFGLEMENKYTIEPIEHEDYLIHQIYPMFNFKDMGKINHLLNKIKITNAQLCHSLNHIVNTLGAKLANGFYGERTDEELDISSSIGEFNNHLKRIGARENEIMDGWRDIFTAAEKGCLPEYKESINLGFHSNIEECGPSDERLIYPPDFFQYIFHATYEKDKMISEPTAYKEIVESIKIEINNSTKFLKRIKEKAILRKRMSQELITGILEMTKLIKEIPTLKEEEKEMYIDQFDDYCIEIRNLNGEEIF